MLDRIVCEQNLHTNFLALKLLNYRKIKLTMRKFTLIAAVATALAFSACNNSSNTETSSSSDTIVEGVADSQTVGQKIDSGINAIDSAGNEAKKDIDEATEKAKADAKSAGDNIKEDLNAAAKDVGAAAKSAGTDVKNAANKVADKTKEGYQNVKESLKRDTTKK
jgi:Skp family chaperone for outer membrane proteins